MMSFIDSTIAKAERMAREKGYSSVKEAIEKENAKGKELLDR